MKCIHAYLIFNKFFVSVSQDKVTTTTSAPSIGQDQHQQRRIPITTPKPRPSQSPGGSFQDHSSHLGDNNKSNGVSSRESENPTATIRVEKNPNFTPGGVPPNEYTTISAAGRPLTLQKKSEINRSHTGGSHLMRISLLRISLLRFFKTITKIWLMRFFGLKILLLRT